MTGLVVLATVLAGGLAAVARYAISSIAASLRSGPRALPWAVLVANVLGSAIGGVALGLADAGVIDGGIRLVLLGGIAGGLSTFSTWSVETIQLVQAARWRVAAASVTANLLLGFLAVWAGYVVTAGLGG